MRGPQRNPLHFQGLEDGGSLAGPLRKDVGAVGVLVRFRARGRRKGSRRWSDNPGEMVSPDVPAALWVGGQTEE